MSKDMIDSVVRAAIGVPQERYDLLAKITSDLAGDNPLGEQWHSHYKAVREKGLPRFAFDRNEHGHIILTIAGLDLTGKQEVERLLAAGYRMSDYAKQCLTSTAADSYDANHRLKAGEVIKLALVPGKEIAKDSNRSTNALRQLGAKYGYGKPLGGHVPRIRESVSDEQMEHMGIEYIASLHDPIKVAGGYPCVLLANRLGGGRWVFAFWDRPGDRWLGSGAFAFPVPAS